MFVIVWEFRVRRDKLGEFQRAYGPNGEWELLFRRGDGFLATELLHDRDDRSRFLTIDKWSSRSAYDAFRSAFEKEYAATDARCEALTESEERVGVFVVG